MAKLLRKICAGGDFHKKATDPPTIQGYCRRQFVCQQKLMNLCVDNAIDTFIITGDWFDRGFTSNVGSALATTDIDREFYNLMKGELYGVIGNHININMDSNPELSLIQPHPVLTSMFPITRTHQIIRTPKTFMVGTVQFSLCHYNFSRGSLTGNKPERFSETTYHIAIYHTPLMVPNQQLMNAGIPTHTTSNVQIGECLKGVDIAICGDIHTPIGQFLVHHDYGSTIMIVPGSLGITTSALKDRHSTVALPIMSVYDDGTVKLEYMNIDLSLNLLRFSTMTEREKSSDKLDGIRKKRKVDSNNLTVIPNSMEASSYNLRNLAILKGYTEKDMELINGILTNPLDVDNLISIFRKEIEEVKM